jgi:hypothetical protein
MHYDCFIPSSPYSLPFKKHIVNFLQVCSCVPFIQLQLVMLKLLSGYTQQAGCIPQSSASVWHPLFGWCKGNIDIRLFRIFGHVQKQLQVLWQPGFIDVAFSDVLGEGASAKCKICTKLYTVCVPAY